MYRIAETRLAVRGAVRTVTLIAASALVIATSGCAPEPGQEAGRIDKEKQTVSPETQWGGQDVPEDILQTKLPESFPVEGFVLPAEAAIYNSGEKNETAWFVVLNADSPEEAQSLWDSIVSQSSFEVTDQVETTEGGISATLNSAMLMVQAVTIPQTDGTVLLSYDISRIAF